MCSRVPAFADNKQTSRIAQASFGTIITNVKPIFVVMNFASSVPNRNFKRFCIIDGKLQLSADQLAWLRRFALNFPRTPFEKEMFRG